MSPLIPHANRPTDMLQRQMLANRKAAQTWCTNEAGGRWKHFSHLATYRRHFVLDILAIKHELRERRESIPKCNERIAPPPPRPR